MAGVDQQRVRRTRTGLIAHDPARALPGYTLFTPMFGDGTVYLIDMQGEVVHTWRLPYRPGCYGYLLDDGHLFYSAKVMEDLERFEAWARFKAGAAMEVDWQGRVLWEVRHRDHHHDARKLRNGNVLLLCLRPLPAEIARRVQGGLPGTEAEGSRPAGADLDVSFRNAKANVQSGANAATARPRRGAPAGPAAGARRTSGVVRTRSGWSPGRRL